MNLMERTGGSNFLCTYCVNFLFLFIYVKKTQYHTIIELEKQAILGYSVTCGSACWGEHVRRNKSEAYSCSRMVIWCLNSMLNFFEKEDEQGMKWFIYLGRFRVT